MDKRSAILQQITAIPQGKVASYGQIAHLAGLPGYARFVGFVLRQLPEDSDIPWQRVVNSKGEIAFPVESAAFEKQCELLHREGVSVVNGKINLRRYGWQP